MSAKRRRRVLGKHIDRKPNFLKEWTTPEQAMYEMIEVPLTALGKRKGEFRACSTHNYMGMTRRSVATLLTELCRKGVLEKRIMGPISQYRRKVS